MSAVLADVGQIDRRTYIGGSDIAKILGIDPYGGTPLTCYLAKIGEAQGTMDPEKKKFLERRKRWEGPIVEMLREEFAVNIVAVNARYVDPFQPFMAAEIDFEWADEHGEIQNGEIKTVSPFAFNEGAGWGEAGTDEIPVHYHAQVQWGLGVKQRQTCIVAAMAGLDTMVFYRVERDEETITGMREAAVSFWRDHVLAKLPPEPITMGDALALFRRRNGRPVELDDQAAAAFENLRLIRSELKTLEGDEAECELEVAKAICKAWGVPDGDEPPEDNAVLTHKGRTLGKWARGRGAYLDQKKLAVDHPEIKVAYTVPTAFRTFRFNKAA